MSVASCSYSRDNSMVLKPLVGDYHQNFPSLARSPFHHTAEYLGNQGHKQWRAAGLYEAKGKMYGTSKSTQIQSFSWFFATDKSSWRPVPCFAFSGQPFGYSVSRRPANPLSGFYVTGTFRMCCGLRLPTNHWRTPPSSPLSLSFRNDTWWQVMGLTAGSMPSARVNRLSSLGIMFLATANEPMKNVACFLATFHPCDMTGWASALWDQERRDVFHL